VGLAEQEKALFALVFDPVSRQAFHLDPGTTLDALGVPLEEHGVFLGLSHFGLDVDARDREFLVLSRLARSFPLTTSAFSAFEGGLELVRGLVGPTHFESPVESRPALFGAELRQAVDRLEGPSDEERELLGALADWEAALALVASSARSAAAHGELDAEPAEDVEVDSDWEQRALSLAPFLVATRFPVSLAALGGTIVPCRPEELWARLGSSPLPRARLADAVRPVDDGRLVIGRAVVARVSPTDSEVTHRTVELAAGFQAFLGRIDGKTSAAKLLDAFVRAGAPTSVVDGVRAGLYRLVEERMLLVAAAV
jgi:hypothetical protein